MGREVHAFNEENVDKALGHLVDKVKNLSFMLDSERVSTERVQGEITNIFLELSSAHSFVSRGVRMLGIQLELMGYELKQARKALEEK